MNVSRPSRIALMLTTVAGLAFLYIPLVVVVGLSFNGPASINWPPRNLTLKWWRQAWRIDAPRAAFFTSVRVAFVAMLIALVLGSLAAFALQRFNFFGRNAISFLLVLPIALPGIVTAIAFQTTFDRTGIGLGFHSVVIAHATFCIVVAYNNVVARLRRLSPNLREASADLGGTGFQTFRLVTFPLVRSALVAGGLLAFALSFDEIVVTTFTAPPGMRTLPQFIFDNYKKPNQVPIVTVTATVVMLLSIPLAYVAQRLSDGAESLSRI